jgi:hypothetical protein
MQPATEPNEAVERVWQALSAESREALMIGMTPTDLQTLLLSVSRARARQVGTARLMRRWGEDRFVRPAVADPRRLAELNAHLWRSLPTEFEGIVLAPVSPLGTCAAVAAVDQNRIVSTVRGSEVVSDPTNVLAIAAADRRRRTGDDVHLATCHRVLRGQRFSDPSAAAHFELFALVSSGRDRGARRTELDFLALHLRAWSALLSETVGDQRAYTMEFSTFGDQQLTELIIERLRPNLPRLVENSERTGGAGYYQGFAIRLVVAAGGRTYEIGDGGLTDWTAQLGSNAKERCLISCIATERLLAATSEG